MRGRLRRRGRLRWRIGHELRADSFFHRFNSEKSPTSRLAQFSAAEADLSQRGGVAVIGRPFACSCPPAHFGGGAKFWLLKGEAVGTWTWMKPTCVARWQALQAWVSLSNSAANFTLLRASTADLTASSGP